MRPRVVGLALALATALAACTSPESTRMRGGGPGADPGNRRDVVQMHEGSQPYWLTPRRLADSLAAPSPTAGQADRLSHGRTSAASPR